MSRFTTGVGRNGEIVIGDEYAVITRNSSMARQCYGEGAVAKHIPLSSISDCRFEPATQSKAGWLQLCMGGYVPPYPSPEILRSDPDAIVFGIESQGEFEALYRILPRLIEQNQLLSPTNNNEANASENLFPPRWAQFLLWPWFTHWRLLPKLITGLSLYFVLLMVFTAMGMETPPPENKKEANTIQASSPSLDDKKKLEEKARLQAQAKEKQAKIAKAKAAQAAQAKKARLKKAAQARRVAQARREAAAKQAAQSNPLDQRYGTCREANDAGVGDYTRGQDPEYEWYDDRDRDGEVCETF